MQNIFSELHEYDMSAFIDVGTLLAVAKKAEFVKQSSIFGGKSEQVVQKSKKSVQMKCQMVWQVQQIIVRCKFRSAN